MYVFASLYLAVHTKKNMQCNSIVSMQLLLASNFVVSPGCLFSFISLDVLFCFLKSFCCLSVFPVYFLSMEYVRLIYARILVSLIINMPGAQNYLQISYFKKEIIERCIAAILGNFVFVRLSFLTELRHIFNKHILSLNKSLH